MSKFTDAMTHEGTPQATGMTPREARQAAAHEWGAGGAAEPAKPPEFCPTMTQILAQRDSSRWPLWLHRNVSAVLYWWASLSEADRKRPWRLYELQGPVGLARKSGAGVTEALIQCGWLRLKIRDGDRDVAVWVHPDSFADVLMKYADVVSP